MTNGGPDDFFVVDFLGVETDKSGDAITIQYRSNGITVVHVVDAGFQDTGPRVVQHVRSHYQAASIDHVVVTHHDGDHTRGLQAVLEEIPVRNLWMLRPWVYAPELLARFPTYTQVDRLASRLKALYPNLAALEAIAERKRIPILEPFQGARIGSFMVLAPSKPRYLVLVEQSERTPESTSDTSRLLDAMFDLAKKAVRFLTEGWGAERFSPNETSVENEMSVVQSALLCGRKVMLTGDVGRGGLLEAITYAPSAGLTLPGVDHFQVPHHGSRRNVSTELLDRLLGKRSGSRADPAQGSWSAIISSAAKDKAHPRKAVVRAMIHRGGRVYVTEGNNIFTGFNVPPRAGYSPIAPVTYPEEQEE